MYIYVTLQSLSNTLPRTDGQTDRHFYFSYYGALYSKLTCCKKPNRHVKRGYSFPILGNLGDWYRNGIRLLAGSEKHAWQVEAGEQFILPSATFSSVPLVEASTRPGNDHSGDLAMRRLIGSSIRISC